MSLTDPTWEFIKGHPCPSSGGSHAGQGSVGKATAHPAVSQGCHSSMSSRDETDDRCAALEQFNLLDSLFIISKVKVLGKGIHKVTSDFKIQSFPIPNC